MFFAHPETHRQSPKGNQVINTLISYLLFLAHTHQLHDALALPACDGVIHRSEGGFVDLHVLLPSRLDGLVCDQHKECRIRIAVLLRGAGISETVVSLNRRSRTFCEAHRPYRWVAEDHCGDGGVVQLGVLLALKQPVCQLPACSDGNCPDMTQ